MKRGLLSALFMFCISSMMADNIVGRVIESGTQEPLIGAAILIEGTTHTTVTDADGFFKLTGLQSGKYTLLVRYVAFHPKLIENISTTTTEEDKGVVIELQPASQQLKEVAITGVMRRNTDASMIQVAKQSDVIVSNVSAQEISRTQDSHVGEAIRRVPGVSLIEDKFVMVRGLSQRYNNVWINGGAVPSSEADARAFSFDMIPGSQIDNLMIVKTPSPEYPADYTGGFILVNTKEIPTENIVNISVGGNYNAQATFRPFVYSKGSATDFLGFDSGMRNLQGGMNAQLKPIAGGGIDLQGNGFSNNWFTQTWNPLPDLKLAATLTRHWKLQQHRLGLIAMVNYTNEYRTYRDMQNNLFGIYDAENDRQNYLRHSIDQQYNHNVRLGGMLNLTFLSANGKHKFQWKNILNQIGNNRYTWREGVSAQSNEEHSAEYYYRSRTTYNGQLTGKHTLANDEIEWSAGYAYANRNLPDRKRYLIDDAIETGTIALTTGNDISREWTRLNEHILSVGINEEHSFDFSGWKPVLKAGAYAEYRTRDYTTREFVYNWNAASNQLPANFRSMDIPTLLSNSDYWGADKLYLLEQMSMRNNYIGHNTLGAGFVVFSLPFGKLNLYSGVRFEHNRMELVSNTRNDVESHFSTYYTGNDFFPSLNATYKLNEKHQLRLSYGRSINRPEFREVSSSVYYDFDLASNVQGNPELKNCYIDNIDLRYEFYPSQGEQISVAAFYKRFKNPIEWTYTVAGGTDLVYSYKNALSANNIGLEVDIKKTLDFIGLPGFSWSFNGAIIHSRVRFEEGAKEANRPMQGQSPYLINSGLFYSNARHGLSVALLYNRIGKRIIGVGRSEGSTIGNDVNARVPDSYEMPRDVIDLTATKKWGDHLELKFALRDLLAQTVYYKQFADVTYPDGRQRQVTEITRSFRPGQNLSLSLTYTF